MKTSNKPKSKSVPKVVRTKGKIDDSLMTLTEKELEDAFPVVDSGCQPFGSRIVVQLRSPKTQSGRIILDDETQDVEKWNTQVAKVVALGPSAFRYRAGPREGELFLEGGWASLGDFVRIPKWNQDKWEVDIDEGTEDVKQYIGDKMEIVKRKKIKQVLFMLVNDLDLLGKITDPLDVKAYIK